MSPLPVEAAELRRWLVDVALPLWWTTGADHAGGGLSRGDRPRRHARRRRRTAHARSRGRCLSMAKPAGSAGTGRGARPPPTRSTICAQRFIRPDGNDRVGGRPRRAASATRRSIFTIKPSACSHWRPGTACSARRPDAGPMRSRCAPRCRHWRIRTADTSRIAIAGCRSAPIPTCISWRARSPGCAIDHDPVWRQMAHNIAQFCLAKFIEPATGALREFFAADWSPAPGIDGRIVEPGHHYEWAYLLARWAELAGRPRPDAIGRLIAFADRHGVDERRGVAVNAVRIDGRPHDPMARLWAQAERVRVYAMDRTANDDARLTAAIRGLQRFLATPTPGTLVRPTGCERSLRRRAGARDQPLSHRRRGHRTGGARGSGSGRAAIAERSPRHAASSIW